MIEKYFTSRAYALFSTLLIGIFFVVMVIGGILLTGGVKHKPNVTLDTIFGYELCMPTGQRIETHQQELECLGDSGGRLYINHQEGFAHYSFYICIALYVILFACLVFDLAQIILKKRFVSKRLLFAHLLSFVLFTVPMLPLIFSSILAAGGL